MDRNQGMESRHIPWTYIERAWCQYMEINILIFAPRNRKECTNMKISFDSFLLLFPSHIHIHYVFSLSMGKYIYTFLLVSPLSFLYRFNNNKTLVSLLLMYFLFEAKREREREMEIWSRLCILYECFTVKHKHCIRNPESNYLSIPLSLRPISLSCHWLFFTDLSLSLSL